MHAPDVVKNVLDLAADGLPAAAIARRTGVPRSTLRSWLGEDAVKARDRARGEACQACHGPAHDFASLPREYVYLLGLYLGDGCLSAHPRGVFKLRLTLDVAHPGIIEEADAAIRHLLPKNKVGRTERGGNFAESRPASNIELYCYSRAWPCLFPQHGPGRKHERTIALADWQRDLVDRHPAALLRGLIHSDGCRFINTGTNWSNPRYSFSNRSADIREIFCAACDLVGVRWTAAPHTIYVSRKDDVALLDTFIGPKR